MEEGVDPDAIGCAQPDLFNFAGIGLEWWEARRISGWKEDQLLFQSPEADKYEDNSGHHSR